MTFVMLRRGPLALAALLLLAAAPTAATAQPTHDQESASPYAAVKGWDVMKVDVDGVFVGCRGAKYGASGPFMIDYSQEGWRLLVPHEDSPGQGVFEGARFAVDNTVIDAQVGLELPHWAALFLEEPQLRLLRGGTVASLQVNGQRKVTAGLSGSSAMLLKVEECFDRGGEPPRTTARMASDSGLAKAAPARKPTSSGPSKPAPVSTEPNAFDAKVVSFRGGRYIYRKGHDWIEQGDNGGRFNFKQVDGNENEIYLVDKSRGVRIVLHMADRMIYYAGPGEQYRPLYKITKVQ